MKKQYFLYLLSLFLLLGSVIAWVTNVQGFRVFYDLEGTIFKFQDCVITNPFLTPCFWGATAFVVLFVWSLFLLRKSNQNKQQKHLSLLLPILFGCMLFGWGNVVIEAVRFYGNPPGVITGCGGKPLLNPFTSSCFFGSILFTLSFFLVLWLNKKKG